MARPGKHFCSGVVFLMYCSCPVVDQTGSHAVLRYVQFGCEHSFCLPRVNTGDLLSAMSYAFRMEVAIHSIVSGTIQAFALLLYNFVTYTLSHYYTH